MTLSRRELLKHGLALGSLAPFAVGWAATGPNTALTARQVTVFGATQHGRALRDGFARAGWQARHGGRLDVMQLARSRPGYWIAGFADDAELVLLTSLAAGRGRIVALGRHAGQTHVVRTWKHADQAIFQPSNPHDWRGDLGHFYADLADDRWPASDAPSPARPANAASGSASAHSFLIRV